MEQPRCSECHRPLSDPKSIARGVGPVCWRKLQAERGITIPTRPVRIPSQRKDRNPHLVEKREEVHQRLDVFINVKTPEEREIDAILEKDREKALPIKKGQLAEV